MIKIARTRIATIKTETTKIATISIAPTKIAKVRIIPGSTTTTGKFRAIGTTSTTTAHPQASGIVIDYAPSMNPGFAMDMSSIGICAEWSTRFLLTTIDVYLLRRAATGTSSSAATWF